MPWGENCVQLGIVHWDPKMGVEEGTERGYNDSCSQLAAGQLGDFICH